MRREKPTGTVKEIISKILKCDKKKILVKSELVIDPAIKQFDFS